MNKDIEGEKRRGWPKKRWKETLTKTYKKGHWEKKEKFDQHDPAWINGKVIDQEEYSIHGSI